MKKWTRYIVGDLELNKDIELLLTIGGLYALSIALSNTFVNIYLWKQSEEFIKLAIFNLSIVTMHPLTFILAGRWAKKIDRIIVLRLGVIFLSCFYLSVLWLGESAENYVVLLGFLLGIGYGFYWLSFNVLTFEITEPETRDFFNGFLGLLTSFAGMIGPIFAGTVITYMNNLKGYSVIFAVSLGLFIVAVILTFFMKRRSAEGAYHLKEVFKVRKEYPPWKQILRANYFQGLREGSFIFVIVVWIFITTGSELAIGTYGLVVSATSFVVYFIVGRFLPKKHRKKAILLGGFILYAAVFIVVFDLSFVKLMTYGVVTAIAYPLLLVPYLSLTYDVIGSGWKAREMRIEYIVIRELYLNAGRISSILFLLLCLFQFGEEKGVPIALTVLGIGHLCIYGWIKKIHLPSTLDKETFTALKKR
ncbi:MFS transporter [Salipaludibacillus daqingensis]|uniref:MFS transporter n=1 Tax=Salipaludibacillus daqingensis TaxID=3041001 RepID=UPI00247317EE|nr:MFS transporter [Salipaludibacillus daqingensis]